MREQEFALENFKSFISRVDFVEEDPSSPIAKEKELQNLSNKISELRLLTVTNGEVIKYPDDTDYPIGHLRELEYDLTPGEILRSGAEVLNRYSEENVFCYVHFIYRSLMIRFSVYFKSEMRHGLFANPIVEGNNTFSFGVYNDDDNPIYKIDGLQLAKMPKNVCNVVSELVDIASSKASKLSIVH